MTSKHCDACLDWKGYDAAYPMQCTSDSCSYASVRYPMNSTRQVNKRKVLLDRLASEPNGFLKELDWVIGCRPFFIDELLYIVPGWEKDEDESELGGKRMGYWFSTLSPPYYYFGQIPQPIHRRDHSTIIEVGFVALS